MAIDWKFWKKIYTIFSYSGKRLNNFFQQYYFDKINIKNISFEEIYPEPVYQILSLQNTRKQCQKLIYNRLALFRLHFSFNLINFTSHNKAQKFDERQFFMRQTQSVDKDSNKILKKHYTSSPDPYSSLSKIKYSVNEKSDVEMLQQFYIEAMIQVYEKDKTQSPDPRKLLSNIKVQDKKLEEIEKQLTLCQQKLKQSQLSLKSQTKTVQSLATDQFNSNKKIQQKVRKSIDEEYFKMKLKFMPIFQQNVIDSQSYLKLTITENQKILDVLFQNISTIIKNLKNTIKLSEEKAYEKISKKFQQIQEKLNKEIKDLTQVNQKFDNKNKDLIQQVKVQNEERKRIEKQKNQLHTEIYKNHQAIVEKSNALEQLRQKIQINLNKIDSYERTVEENERIIYRYESKLKDMEQTYAELDQKYKQLQNNHDKTQKEMAVLRRKFQQELTSSLPRVRSQSSSTSIRALQEDDNKNQAITLRNRIKILEQKIAENEKIKKEYVEKQKNNLEKVIVQWKNTLQRIIEENDREMVAKDILISTLQKQIAQLRKQLGIREEFKLLQQQMESKSNQNEKQSKSSTP